MEEIEANLNVVVKKKGGARTLPFIFANEVCERLAIAGFGANLFSYLTQVLHLPLTKSANILTNFGGSTTLTMFVGAFIADSYAGRFWTITVASVIYLLSMICMTLSATLPGLTPPPCKGDEICKEANGGQLSVFYLCLILASIGAGGLRPCVVAFGADQFDESNPEQKAKPWNYFNWYYIVMGLSILVAVTVFVYIQDHVGWGWGIDKAGMLTEKDKLPTGTLNLWRVSTVHRVEELKSILRMAPIWASGLLYITATAQQGTFTIQQARTMDRHITPSFQIPPASMSVFNTIAMLITVILYDRVLIPVARHFTGVDRGISYLHRMSIGFAIATIATFISGFLEIKRKNVASAYQLIDSPKAIIPISVFWLVPQYVLYGVADAFMSVGHLEYFFDQSPESIRSTATAFYWGAVAAGSYLSSVLVTLVHKYSAGPNGSNWLQDYNINKGKLEYFYWLITFLQVVNLVYYMICVKYYTFKAVQVQYKGRESEVQNERTD
ncbi:hypothetical protein IFM89_020475 [Coptis chinensis]|uniref:Uncharacterized protein n=1 Tax=Coptis chinensis TaxID=261450 RepID=A0A835H6V4_9MAGN|nr:hypothetical protein IFM89_020475 [Coptis chinensis]